MKAEIIAIGTEILLGDIVNTNSQYLAKELALLGVDIYYQSVVGDNEERILKAFKEAYERSDLVITTGGLGPTQDDLTKELASKFFNKEMKLNEEVANELEVYMSKLNKNIVGRNSLGSNIKQAYFPVGCRILSNDCGTAPGVLIEENKKIMIILPGPPKEMKSMFEREVIPYFKSKNNKILKSKTLRIFGIGESFMAEKVGELINNGTNPTVAPYAKESDVILRITAKGKDENECIKLIEPVEKEIRDILKDYIYGTGEEGLNFVIGDILTRNKLTISTAESCTGGMIAEKLISYPGISESFIEGFVTYSNEAKMKRLNVSEETLKKYGAVSEETAKEMAIGVCKASGSNVSVVTTGIAGPGGGSDEKPVGLVYIAVHILGDTIVEKFNFLGDRERVRVRSTMNGLNLLRINLAKKGYK